MRPIVIATTALTNDANGVCESQTPAAGGVQSLSLDGALVSGGVATIAESQIITATWAGADAARTLTVTYKDADGIEQTGTIAGANATTSSGTFYAKSISGITVDDDTAGAVEVGALSTNGAVTRSVRVNRNQVSSFKLGQFVELSSGASMTYSAQHSPDWPESGDFTSGYSNNANWYDTDGLTALTATDESNIVIPVECVRVKITAYTSGTLTFTTLQNY